MGNAECHRSILTVISYLATILPVRVGGIGRLQERLGLWLYTAGYQGKDEKRGEERRGEERRGEERRREDTMLFFNYHNVSTCCKSIQAHVKLAW